MLTHQQTATGQQVEKFWKACCLIYELVSMMV
jgi:hypothetical protein